MFGNSLEAIIIKYTLGACFLGITVMFLLKLGMLVITVAKLKALAFFEGNELLKILIERVIAK